MLDSRLRPGCVYDGHLTTECCLDHPHSSLRSELIRANPARFIAVKHGSALHSRGISTTYASHLGLYLVADQCSPGAGWCRGQKKVCVTNIDLKVRTL